MNTNLYHTLIRIKQRLFKSKFIRDSFWSLLGNIVGRGLSLLAGIVVARFLGKEIYGEYGIIKSTILSLSVFSTFGLGYTATKYVAEFKNSKQEYLNLILKYSRYITLIVSGIIALLLFSFADYISETILKASHLNVHLRLVSIWVIIGALTTTQIGILAGFGQFKEMAKIHGIVGFVTFVLSVLFTYIWGLFGALFALLVAQIFNLYLNFRLVNKHKSKYNFYKKDQKFLRDVLNFSLPVAMQEILYSLMGWILNYLLIRYANYGELGIYTAAMQWNCLILFIPGVLRNVILSHISETTNNTLRHQRILTNTLIINLLSTFIPFIIVYIFSGHIVAFYGSSFEELKIVLRTLVFSTIFLSLSNTFAQSYLSLGKSWLMFYIRFIRDFGKIVIGYVLLVHIEGINGALSLAYTQLGMSIIFLILMAGIYYSNLKKWI